MTSFMCIIVVVIKADKPTTDAFSRSAVSMMVPAGTSLPRSMILNP